MPSQQSAYRQHHSTETVVLKVYNDLLMAADSGLVYALCLLDLTAAFDTVDHDLLLLRLERQFGLRGVTLLWFRSYLSGRSYRVWFAGAASRTVHVICSVAQGSVLGLRLFTVYSADLVDNDDKAVEHAINFHGYADDTQLYVHCRLEEIAATRNYSQTGTLHHRHGQCRLLQCNPRHGSEDNNRQATTSVKRCCTSRQRHQKV